MLRLEERSVEDSDPLLREWLTCESSRTAGGVLGRALRAGGLFERDRTPLLPPPCSLPPLV